MKSAIKYLLIFTVFTLFAPARADEGGEEAESAKTFDLDFYSRSDSKNAGASVSYTVPLTGNLDFSTSTSLKNGYNPEDNRSSRGRNTSLTIDYDPPSPWRLNVSYGNSYDLVHRPPGEEYDEFKTESSSNGVNSSLDYQFSDDLKTDLRLGVQDSSQEILIARGEEVPPPTTSRTHNFGGGVDYNLTAATTLSLDYTGDISSSKIEVAKTRTYPPRKPKPAVSRKIGNTISGQIGMNKDLSEKLNLNLSFGVTDGVARDKLEPALDSDALNGNASGDVTYNVSSLLSLTNSVSFTGGRDFYENKDRYRKLLNEVRYDVERAGFENTANIRVTPGEHSEVNVAVNYKESENFLRDADGKLPPRDEPSSASSCEISKSYKITSDFDLALGEDVTFHLAHYLTESRPHKLVFPEQDQTTKFNNLDGNVGFDWTEDLHVDVNTAMNVVIYRYKDPDSAIDNNHDDLKILLGTSFIYDVTSDTTVEIKTDISKNSTAFVDPLTTRTDSAQINRHLYTNIRRDFGELFKPNVGVNITYGRDYFPASPRTNKRRWNIGVNPGTEINTSDKLKLNLSFSYSREKIEGVFEPDPEDWQIIYGYAGGAGVTYVVSENLTLTASSSSSHSYHIKNSIRRYKEVPAETFFDLDAGLNFSF
ncbi:MAG TPA: hypothetical protein VMX79_03780 [bacterium]|nr:hypothetical protein [bacterium]